MEDKKVITTSKTFSLDWRDGIKGLLISVTTAALLALEQSLSAGEVTINLQKIGVSAAVAGIAYLLKNFFTPSEEKKSIK